LAERFFPDDPFEYGGLPRKKCIALVASSLASRHHRHRASSEAAFDQDFVEHLIGEIKRRTNVVAVFA
jgi:hypothetical protein